MLKLIALFVILLLTNINYAQPVSQNNTTYKKVNKVKDAKPFQRRNLFWFTPANANEINGLAVGFSASSAMANTDSVKVNGVNIEANPMAIIALPYVLIGTIALPFEKI